MALVDTIKIRVNGQGGHGAQPHLCVDPVVVACQIVLALEYIVSRQVNPIDERALETESGLMAFLAVSELND